MCLPRGELRSPRVGRGEGIGRQESVNVCSVNRCEDTGRPQGKAGSRHGLWGWRCAPSWRRVTGEHICVVQTLVSVKLPTGYQ